MRIYILVIVANRKFTILAVKAMTTEIILTRCTDAVSSPVSERTCNSVQKWIVCINSTTLSHCHMMWRVKTGGSDITDRSCQFILTVNRIDRTECIAVILDQPQVVSITKLFYCFQVKWISKCMCKHDSFCLRRPCSFQKGRINVVLWNGHIDKYRYGPILDHRRNRCRETCRNRDHLISRKDLTFFQEWRSQRHKSKQVRGRSGVYQ